MSQIIKLQQLTAIIHNSSRLGLDHDIVHVETLLNTTEPLPQGSSWFVPAGVNVPQAVLDILKLGNLQLYPMKSDTLLNGTEDIAKSAQEGNLQDVINDSSKLLLLSILKNTTICPIAGSTTLYKLSYDYNLYPTSDGYYELHVQLPFDGLELNPAGGKVQVSVLCPLGSTVDQVFTKGVDENKTEITEAITNTQNNVIVTFNYQKDPLFAVRYKYQ